MTTLYSYQGQEPQELPHKLRLSDGKTRTDSSTFTEKELADAGFTGPYEVPEYNQEYQKLYWNSENLSFDVEDISEEELWERIRVRRNQLLLESDWSMVGDAPDTLNFREWEMYRQRLRDLTQNFETPQDVIWPISPEGRSDEDFDQPRIYQSKIIGRISDLQDNIRIINEKLDIMKPVGISSTGV